MKNELNRKRNLLIDECLSDDRKYYIGDVSKTNEQLTLVAIEMGRLT
jgi:hypothetical protein